MCLAHQSKYVETKIFADQVHGIGAVSAAKLVERGIRSLAQLRDAVEKNQVHLDSAQVTLDDHLIVDLTAMHRREMHAKQADAMLVHAC